MGSAVPICLLSTGLSGRSRQVAMYLVLYNVLVCAVLVPMLFPELHSGVPLVKAPVFAVDLELDRQMALVYVFLGVFPLPVVLAGVGSWVRVLERL